MPTTTGKATDFIQFSRASNGTVTDSDGKVKWAPHNLLQMSEQLDGTAWAKGNSTITANSTVAPNGTTTADTMTGTGSSPAVYQSYSAIVGTLTYAIYLKAGTLSTANLRLSQAAVGYEATFTLTGSGVAGTPTIVGTGGTVSNVTSNISALDNGWYRCALTFSETGSGNVMVILNATSGTVYLWGAHLYRSDLGGMQANTSAYPMYNPTTPKNLLGYTESFDNSYWTRPGLLSFGSGSVANAAIAPNGLSTADLIVEDISTGRHDIYTGPTTVVAGSTFTFSAYLKSAGRTRCYMTVGNGANICRAVMDLSAVTATIDNTGTATTTSATITDAGNGWYRCRITGTIPSTAAYPGVALLQSGTTSSYTGDGTSGIYIWGLQLSDSASLDTYTSNNFAAPSAAAYYGPRLDYDPTTLAAKGLLVEEQRTNILLNSATLSTQNVTVSATAYTLSFWGTGTVTLSGTSTAGPLVGTGANNRVTLTFTPTAGALTLTVTGTVTQAQLEAGSFATSYIPTTSASVTRSADVAQVGTSAFPYSSTAGTLVVSGQSLTAAGFPYLASLNDGTSNNDIYLNFQSGLRAGVVAGGVVQAFWNPATIVGTNKLAVAYSANNFGAATNGVAQADDTSGTVPSGVTILSIGRSPALNGWVRQITYIPRRLTNAELQTRTA